nr:malectin-B [Onthophagus taurus]
MSRYRLCTILKALIAVLLIFSSCINHAVCMGQIVYAINCGGEAHTDSDGVYYERDPLHGKIGTASDYGKRFHIGRVPQNDHVLYQTERYHTNTFGYDIPLYTDGEYVLVLKFCEVYFNGPDQKVFDVVLNGDHVIISDLDIFDKVGRGVAHDEYVPFKISKGKLYYNEEESSEIRGNRIRVEFIKGYKDNPKINAMYVVKGKVDSVPKLAPLEVEQVEEEPEIIPIKNRRPSGPKQPDPYEIDDSSTMLPVFIAIGTFIPLLFCLCRL